MYLAMLPPVYVDLLDTDILDINIEGLSSRLECNTDLYQSSVFVAT